MDQYGYGSRNERLKIRPDDDRSARVSVHMLLGLDRLCRILPGAIAAGAVKDTELRSLLSALTREHERYRRATGGQAELEQRYGWQGGRDDQA